MAARLLIAFIVVPIAELWLLIEVGRQIGALATVVIVVITAIVGSQLARRQGIDVLARIRKTQARGEMPALPMLNGAALLLAGFMLLTPGLITDAVGFALLIPRLRERIARYLVSRIIVSTPFGRQSPFGDSDTDNDDDSVIEGEYERRKDQPRRNLRNGHDHHRS
ncbi:FxsA family protein [Salinisphaera sp. USBA-960]|uniref:FxsA family protein n=1 Tax=Salinisphaera orenii TaxID=856731 RepID=UPI000DBE10E1|nr:FxsA family protein [Salifodinibacter halophilus]NNC25476.1 FxsA family protein [Salifodinibacter halophilus]